MCIIIHREAGAGHLSDDVINHHRRANPDGFGIAWRTGSGVEAVKFGPDDFERFHQRLAAIDAQDDVEYVAHFRTATHGAPCEDLSHPFSYDDAKDGKVFVFHNGIIPIKTPKGLSDTAQFVQSVLAKLSPRWWLNSAYQFLVEQSVGYSRLLIMTDNETVRFNQNQWTKRDGIWYSATPLPSAHGKTYYSPTTVTSGKGGSSSDPKAHTPQQWNGWIKGKDGIWRQNSAGPKEGVLDAAPETEDTEDEDENLGWFQNGHYITALTEEVDELGDNCGTCICTVCHTIGEWYEIEGKTYIDIDHVEEVDDDEETDEQTLKEVMSA